jgi:hypothetical protein
MTKLRHQSYKPLHYIKNIEIEWTMAALRIGTITSLVAAAAGKKIPQTNRGNHPPRTGLDSGAGWEEC